MCIEANEFYTDDDKCIRKFTIIMNHIITNKIDVICFQVIYIMMFIIYFYQCSKINRYCQTQGWNLIYIKFQIFFYILTLMRIIQLTYSFIGFFIDQRPNGWSLFEDQKKILYYCDYQFKMAEQETCRVRYEINGFFSDFILLFNNIVIQMISFFWQNQISPLSFMNLTTVIFDEKIKYLTKVLYAFFTLMNISMFLFQTVICILGYTEKLIQWLQYFQLISTVLTFLFFCLQVYKCVKNKSLLFHDQIIAIGTVVFIILRISYLIIRLNDLDENSLKDNYQKTAQQSILYFLINLIQELGFKICLIKLF